MKDEEIITKLAKQYDFIYSPNVAASENFDEDKYTKTYRKYGSKCAVCTT